VYALINLLHFEGGSPLYGDVSLVLSPATVSARALLSPFDTGSWSGRCNATVPPSPAYAHNCSAYPGHGGLGTLRHTAHTILANEIYWSTSRALTLKRERLFAPLAAPPALTGADFVHYLEAVPAATLRFADDVRFVIADFSSLFGAAVGAQLQRWCVRQGWPLAWSLSLNLGPMTAPRFWSVGDLPGPFGTDAYARLLDPTVATAVGANASVTVADLHEFDDVWSAAAIARGPDVAVAAMTNRSVPWAPSVWEGLWYRLRNATGAALHVSPLRARACADLERCIGLAEAGDACVCY